MGSLHDRPYAFIACSFVSLCLLSASCSGSQSPSSGTLALSLTDAPAPGYQALYVTIAEVQVHRAGTPETEWFSVCSPETTFNLMELLNGSLDPVGAASLEAGTYTGMRIILGRSPDRELNILDHAHPHANYLVTASGAEIELKVQRGFAPGILIEHPFTVDPLYTTELVLDFDALHSVAKTGSAGAMLLKPVIKVVDIAQSATVSGSALDRDGNALAGVRVSAQTLGAATATGSTAGATLTDDSGSYLLHVEPGTRLQPRTHLLVAYADGYAPACRKLTAPYVMNYPAEFILEPAPMGTITCRISLPRGRADTTAVVEFRQPAPGTGSDLVTIKTFTAGENGSYDIALPAGTYTVAAACEGSENVVEGIPTGGLVSVSF
ncbi:MAG TPA: DUF4382 domain-containing protein [Deltaproteobacteria bacterium]|nr:DUF4382 domain-containing protein [Deltaproteobacteria bacterium]